ncbi:MAG: ATP-binding protein [Candidatus Eisenbacteria bacterium]|nr:ATP-binding protein [Candidatus Latescibacterota bacterium]MBD3301762.1 ATP-binding protein [Candidatus Eisenbacteria bacterium]
MEGGGDGGDAERGAVVDQVIQLAIPSRLELLPVLDRLVQGIAEQMDFSEDEADAIAISVIEAGTNAIQHGHKKDASKTVEFRFNLNPDHLQVVVRDTGPGFDVDAVLSSDPTRPEDLMKSSGRGIFIMRQMMDRVDFAIRPREGTFVYLRKSKDVNGRGVAPA